MATRLALTSSLLSLAGFAFGGCDCGGRSLIDARARLVIDKESIDFGEVAVGGQRVASFQLRNAGLSPLAIERFEIGGSSEIAFATPVPERLQPEQSLEFNIVFEPRDVGEELASITIVADDSDEVRSVSARGFGVEAGVSATHAHSTCGADPSSIDFGRVVPGDVADRSLTVRATGSASVMILSAVVDPGSSGEWSIEGVAEPKRLAPGESIELTAHYAPEDGGPDLGAFVITTDVPNTASIRIGACGEAVAPALCARPNPLDLGAAVVGGSLLGTLTLESCGLEPVTISALRLSADPRFPSAPGFSLASLPSLPRTMQPGETFDVTVDFLVQQLGVSAAYLQATSTALGHEEAFFPISARGAEPCDLLVAPTSLSYVDVAVGQAVSKNVLIANEGASTCTISQLEIGLGAPPFLLSNSPPLPFDVAPGASRIVSVDYAPAQAGMPDVGRLDVENGGAITHVDLIGNPELGDGCHVEIVPPFLNFGAVEPGGTRTLAVDVVNISGNGCFITGVSLAAGSASEFAETASNFSIIPPGASKQVSVTYTPSAPGSATGTLEIETNDALTNVFQVPLFAAAAAKGICVEPRHVAFGPTPGTATMDFIIYACGSSALEIAALDWTAPDSEITLLNPPALPLTIPSGDDRSITVQYSSSDAQGDTAVVTVRSDDAVEPAIDVTVTGGPEIVPPSAGRYLYFWQIPNAVIGGDIVQLPLQGALSPLPYWGPRTGKLCSGCHTVSPDGHYVAIVEGPSLKIIDTRTNVEIASSTFMGSTYFSWKPDVNTNPPYQYAYDDGSNIKIGALFTGELRTLAGADDPSFYQLMPSWSSDGRIAFVRGAQVTSGMMGGSFGFVGPTDVMVVDEAGGPAQLVAGNNGGANYYAQFSPNALWIAYTYSAQAMGTVAAPDAVLKLASSGSTNVILDLPQANSAPGDGASSFPTWAVDGSFLSFASNRSGGAGSWDIYLAPIDPATGSDGSAVPLTSANTSDFEHGAQWSP